MKPAIAESGLVSAAPRQQSAASWQHLLLVALAMLLPLLCFPDTALSIAEIWQRSDTYAHGYLVLPISLWLIWRQRARLAAMPLQPYWPALLPLLACGAAWLAGDLGDVQVVRQYALAVMLPLAVLAIIGWRGARELAFPLLFVLFAVPIGENLITPLIQVTASFTVEALRWSGVPVVREGNHISIPSGEWSVVEACSGLRYLVSSVTLGFLYAYLTYRSYWRRAVFVLAAILVPIAANGARAYMIIMLGHLSGMKLAVGVDHLIYGWVFFGLVMLLLFWIGSYWRDNEQAPADPAPTAAAPVAGGRLAGAGVAVLCCLGMWPAYLHALDQRGASVPPLPLASYRSGLPAVLPFADWQPDYPAPTAAAREFVSTPLGEVGLTLLYYRDQSGGAKLISSANHLTVFQGPWRELDSRVYTEPASGQPVRETVISGKGQKLLLWQWYVIGNARTHSDYQGKLLQAKQKMLTGRSDGVIVMIFSPYNKDVDMTRVALGRFMQDHGAALQRAASGNQQP